MAQGRLTEQEMNILRKNPFVSDVDETRIIYTNKFKFHFMKEYLEGKKPKQIFVEAGFDTEILGAKRIERAARRWRDSYNAGGLGTYHDGTVKNRVRKKDNEPMRNILLQKIDALQKEVEELRRENELLRNNMK